MVYAKLSHQDTVLMKFEVEKRYESTSGDSRKKKKYLLVIWEQGSKSLWTLNGL